MITKQNRILCPICKKTKNKPKDVYCNKHSLAQKSLKKGYKDWLKAYSTISWDEYIKNILDFGDLLGILVREVVEYELYFKLN